MKAIKRQSRKLLVSAVMTVASLALYSTANAGQWDTTLTPVPSPGNNGVEGASVAKIGKNIIFTNGYDNGDTDLTRIYNIPSDSWSFGANAPGFSSEGAGVSHGGLFYQIGGRHAGPGSASRTDLWAYSPPHDAWDTSLSPMNIARSAPAVAVVGNGIYAIGGRLTAGGPCTGVAVASVEYYDIDTDTWTNVASLRSARSDAAAATVGGMVYVFGGCDAAGAFLTNVEVYDPVTDTWDDTSLTPMPTPRASMYAVATKGNEVFVIGGYNGSSLTTNEAYKVSMDTWRTPAGDSMPTARAEAGAVGHGGRIYIIGGGAFGFSTPANEAYKP